MSKTYLQLGRYGDLINVLPFLHHEAQNGEKPRLVVAKEFASVLEGVSYVEPVIFDGPPSDIAAAMTIAGKGTVSTQVNGPLDQIKEHTYLPAGQEHAKTTSFQKEQWKVAGHIKLWDELSHHLIFDRRDNERESKLVTKVLAQSRKRRVILVSADGTSSPFPYRDLLWTLLKLRFHKGYMLVDLSAVKAERIYDLLALYEKAHCLVSIDTAPLALARAVPTLPVIALTNDRPFLWNGSAWQPQWIWSCRYHDFPQRALEILEACANGKESRLCDYSVQVHPGMFGRDSSLVYKDDKRLPFLRDIVRAGLRRGLPQIVIARDGVKMTSEIPSGYPAFAYRLKDGQFSPVGDFFSAPTDLWNTILPDIPDMFLGRDFYWSECLVRLFRKHGALDVTGICQNIEAPSNSPKEPKEPARLTHNRELLSSIVKQSPTSGRYPSVRQQVETIPLQSVKLQPFGYNPAVGEHDGKMLLCYRYHEDTLATKLAIATITETGEVLDNTLLQGEGHSLEDPRLFPLSNGQLWASWTESYFPIAYSSSIRYGAIKGHVLAESQRPDYGQNDGMHREKNWVWFEHNEGIYFIYRCHQKQTVVRWSGEMENEYVTDAPTWPYGEIRGGTPPLLYDGKLLRFFHSSLRNERFGPVWRYYVGAMLMDDQPPFTIRAVSKKPILYGSEADDLGENPKATCFHHKPSVVFPAGAVARNGHWILSLGVNDSACVLAKIVPKELNL